MSENRRTQGEIFLTHTVHELQLSTDIWEGKDLYSLYHFIYAPRRVRRSLLIVTDKATNYASASEDCLNWRYINTRIHPFIHSCYRVFN